MIKRTALVPSDDGRPADIELAGDKSGNDTVDTNTMKIVSIHSGSSRSSNSPTTPTTPTTNDDELTTAGGGSSASTAVSTYLDNDGALIRIAVAKKLLDPEDAAKREKICCKGRSIPFPVKLMYLLEECQMEFGHIISWAPDGLSFVIHDSKQIEKCVLPKIFKDTKFKSFLRKLYRWKFSKRAMKDKRISYMNNKFVRGDYSLCMGMSCSNPANQSQGYSYANACGQGDGQGAKAKHTPMEERVAIVMNLPQHHRNLNHIHNYNCNHNHNLNHNHNCIHNHDYNRNCNCIHNHDYNRNGNRLNLPGTTNTYFNPVIPMQYVLQNQAHLMLSNQCSNQKWFNNERYNGSERSRSRSQNNNEQCDRGIQYTNEVRGEIQYVNEVRGVVEEEEDNYSGVSNEVAWEKMFDELKKFKENHGHMCVPYKFKIYSKLKVDKSPLSAAQRRERERERGGGGERGGERSEMTPPRGGGGDPMQMNNGNGNITQSSHSSNDNTKVSTVIVADVPQSSSVPDGCRSFQCENDDEQENTNSVDDDNDDYDDDDDRSSIFSDDESLCETGTCTSH